MTEPRLELRLFDNHNAELFNGTDQSKAVVLQLQTPPSKDVSPQLVKRIDHGSYGEPYYADSMGSYNLLPNGNEIVGWGQVATSSEYGPDGELRWEAAFGTPGLVFSYRFYKNEWHATPEAWDPNLVVSPRSLELGPVSNRCCRLRMARPTSLGMVQRKSRHGRSIQARVKIDSCVLLSP